MKANANASEERDRWEQTRTISPHEDAATTCLNTEIDERRKGKRGTDDTGQPRESVVSSLQRRVNELDTAMSPASRLGNTLANEVIEEIGQSTRGSCKVSAEIAFHTPEDMVMIFVRMTAKDTVRTSDAGFKPAFR